MSEERTDSVRSDREHEHGDADLCIEFTVSGSHAVAGYRLFEEAQQKIRVEGFFERHPLHLALAVDGADNAAVKTFGGLTNNRCFALGRKAAAGMRLGFDRRFVAPPDLCILGLCPGLNVWIFFLQPAFDFSRSLFVSAFKRALRGKS